VIITFFISLSFMKIWLFTGINAKGMPKPSQSLMK